MTELKPCPFCGGEAIITDVVCYMTIPGVECTSCTAMVVGDETIEEAIDAWNRRTTDD